MAWFVASGALLFGVALVLIVLRWPDDGVWNLPIAFSPDGTMLAAGNLRKDLVLWDIEPLRQRATLNLQPTGHPRLRSGYPWITCLEFSPDASLLAVGIEVGDTGQTVAIGQCVLFGSELREGYTLPFDHPDGVFSVAFSATGDTLATGSGDGTVVLWSIPSRLRKAVLKHPHPGKLVRFSADGQWLITAGDNSESNNEVRIWDATRWQPKTTIVWRNNRSAIDSLTTVPKSTKFVTGGFQLVAVWDALTGKELVSFQVHPNMVTALAVSQDGASLATAGLNTREPESRVVNLWELATGRHLATFSPPNDQAVRSLAFSPDGRLLAAGCENKCVVFWDLSTKAAVRTLK
jgi:WD40 repeat protein